MKKQKKKTIVAGKVIYKKQWTGTDTVILNLKRLIFSKKQNYSYKKIQGKESWQSKALHNKICLPN